MSSKGNTKESSMGEGGPFSTIIVLNLSLKKLGHVAGSVPKINVNSFDSDEIKWFEESFKEANVLVKSMSGFNGFSWTLSEVTVDADVFSVWLVITLLLADSWTVVCWKFFYDPACFFMFASFSAFLFLY